MKMFRLGFALFLGILLGVVSAGAIPIVLTTSSSQYIGSVDPSTPANEASEVAYINKLIGMGLNATTSFNGNELVRSGNSFGTLPVATLLPDWDKDETNPSNVIDITGWTYLYGKYGNGNAAIGAYVWFVGDLTGEVQVPADRLSHWSVYNGTSTSVPDGGTTVMLLGAALLGLGALKRRIR